MIIQKKHSYIGILYLDKILTLNKNGEKRVDLYPLVFLFILIQYMLLLMLKIRDSIDI